MGFRAVKRMEYHNGTGINGLAVIQPGTILKEAHWSDMGSDDREAFKKMVKRQKQRQPNERLGFFHYDGRIRAAVFMKEIRPVRHRDE